MSSLQAKLWRDVNLPFTILLPSLIISSGFHKSHILMLVSELYKSPFYSPKPPEHRLQSCKKILDILPKFTLKAIKSEHKSNQTTVLRTTTSITDFSSPNPEKGQVEKQNSGGPAAQVWNLLFGGTKKAPSTVSCTLWRDMPKKAGEMHCFCNMLSCHLTATALGRLF